ncbi:MAG: undecaprenyl-diphosphate phosphatase [Clostridiales bacterium]|nr:undecaprenyl-diphosphate phosphatase [Candidatus Blautia equi]
MTAFQSILLGIIQGVTEYLPVSSSGHHVILRKFWGIPGDFSTLFSVFLDLGTMLAIILLMRKEVLSILLEWLGLASDLLANFLIYMKNRRSDTKKKYVKLITSKSRKYAVMILMGTLPTYILGYAGRRLVFIWSLSPVWPAIGFLMTAIIILVCSMSNAGGKKGISDASLDQGMWIGIAQGLSVFPGISRCAVTYCGGLFFGYSQNFAIRYCYLLSIPATLGSFLFELGEFSSRSMTGSIFGTCFLGMIAAFVTGYLCIRFMMIILKKIPLWIFSVYCFVMGIIVLVNNFSSLS